MSLPNLFELQEHLSRENLLICFSGPFRHSIIEELGSAVRRYLESQNVESGAMMDVFSVYIELAQNVRNYTTSKGITDPAFTNGILVIGQEGDRYLVTSGNMILPEDVAPLTAKLDALRDLDKTALRRLFKEQMRKPREAGAPGAGAGLIDMARKASEPLRYRVRPIDEQRSFFSLAAIV